VDTGPPWFLVAGSVLIAWAAQQKTWFDRPGRPRIVRAYFAVVRGAAVVYAVIIVLIKFYSVLGAG
jgi:hypothetical protein